MAHGPNCNLLETNKSAGVGKEGFDFQVFEE